MLSAYWYHPIFFPSVNMEKERTEINETMAVQYWIVFPNFQPKPELAPDAFFSIDWLRAGWAFAAALNITLGVADEDGCKAESGSRGPSPYIGCRAMNWGCICWLLPYPEMNGCEGEPVIIGCLLLAVLLTMEGPTPGRFIDEVAPAGPIWVDIMRVRSVAILCLALSTCSHSFINSVSTSANCLSLSSNLFNCINGKQKSQQKNDHRGHLPREGNEKYLNLDDTI